MKQEEKARAYDEALERARKKYQEIPVDYLEYVFPELRESEDDRIRKEIIEFLQSFGETDEWIAWLEKQKEQEHICDSAQFEEGFKTGLEIGLMKQKEQKPVGYLDKDKIYTIMIKLTNLSYSTLIPINSDEFKKLHEITSEIRSLLDYPIEQKPAEWSEEDNIGWDEALACVARTEITAKNEEELQNAVTAEKWLKEIKFKYYVHPVKQEWSEEDEMYLSQAIETLEHENYLILAEKLKSLRPQQHSWSKEDRNMLDIIISELEQEGKNANVPGLYHLEIDFLKSLKPQPKQEWSEADEVYLEDALWCVEKAEKSCKDGEDKGACWSARRWLKSLRPSWKPTEEQMTAILRAEGVLRLHEQEEVAKRLAELYEQLKKLKEDKI